MTLASPRFDGLEVPVDVLLTQELVNTKRPGDAPVVDLLRDRSTAQVWLDEVLSRSPGFGGSSAAVPRLVEEDLPELRELRTVVEAELAHGGVRPRALRGAVQLSTRDRGVVAVQPLGASPAAWLESGVLAERLRAEIGGTWTRLKLCANADCRVAFYDRSRNRSGMWHSVERCGNKINLRNLRARRAAGSDGDEPARAGRGGAA